MISILSDPWIQPLIFESAAKFAKLLPEKRLSTTVRELVEPGKACKKKFSEFRTQRVIRFAYRVQLIEHTENDSSPLNDEATTDTLYWFRDPNSSIQALFSAESLVE